MTPTNIVCKLCSKEFSDYASNKRSFCSLECSRKNLKGKNIGNKFGSVNKGRKFSEEHKKNISESKRGDKHHLWGKHHSKETCQKLSEARKGENNERWKGGITPINNQIRNSLEYKLWRKSVFSRDNYACVACGDDRGRNLNADHVIPFAELRDAENIDTLEKAQKSVTLWDVLNGQTLCVPCHKKTNTYARNIAI